MIVSAKSVALFSTTASAGLLAVALVAQYGFGLHPCELCLLQRYPYAAIIPIGIVAAGLRRPRFWQMAAWLCVLLFLLDGGIAAYHAGVEAGIFTGPTACTSNAASGQTLEEMRRAIMEAQLVPCDQPMAHFLGLSMAAWNGLAAFALACITGIALIFSKRKKIYDAA